MKSRFFQGLLAVIAFQATSPALFCSAREGPVADRARQQEHAVREPRLGKFEILAAYTYAKALRGGLSDREAKERGIVAAVMGARSRGIRRGGRNRSGSSSSKQEPRTKKRVLTAETYDEQVRNKLQPFHDAVFLPTMKKLVDSGLSYNQVKKLVQIPSAIGAKITADEFTRRTASYLKQSGKP